jgi:hypothetical protein
VQSCESNDVSEEHIGYIFGVSQARKQLEAGRKKNLLCFLFDPEAGRDMFLRHIDLVSLSDMLFYPRR